MDLGTANTIIISDDKIVVDEPSVVALDRPYTREHPLVYEDAWDLWPYVYLNDKGQPEGYNIDMLQLLLKELDIPYVIRLKPTSEALEDLKAGRSDLMLGMVASFHDEFADYGREVVSLFTHSVVTPKSLGISSWVASS